jgi:hypothetical protein
MYHEDDWVASSVSCEADGHLQTLSVGVVDECWCAVNLAGQRWHDDYAE